MAEKRGWIKMKKAILHLILAQKQRSDRKAILDEKHSLGKDLEVRDSTWGYLVYDEG